ncbi:MAG: hypothetical protein ABI647_00465 [Gemmatimonadota bacterium]
MTDQIDHEGELRSEFAALRSQEEAFAPGFERVRSGAPRRRPAPRSWLVPSVALASAAVVAAVWLAVRKPAVTPWGEGSAVDVAAWRSPTDALIRGTDVGWLDTVPSLRSGPAWTTAPSPADSVNRGTN